MAASMEAVKLLLYRCARGRKEGYQELLTGSRWGSPPCRTGSSASTSNCHRNTERERNIAIASWPAKRPIAHQPSSQKQNLACFEVGLLLACLPSAHRGEKHTRPGQRLKATASLCLARRDRERRTSRDPVKKTKRERRTGVFPSLAVGTD